MTALRHPLAWALALSACGALLAVATPAAATYPPKPCGSIEVRGKPYKIKGDVKCRFARRWSRSILSGEGKPAGWSCERYGKRSSIALTCRKPGKTFFAVRK